MSHPSSSKFNPNWGGKRAGAGRRKNYSSSSSQGPRDSNLQEPSTSRIATKSGSWRPWMTTEQPTVGFFAPKSAATRASVSAVVNGPSETSRVNSSSQGPIVVLESDGSSNLSQHQSSDASRLNSGNVLVPDAIVQIPHIPAETLVQLNDHLVFIHDHDEHADIATSADTVDDSLVDDILQSTQDTSAAELDETQGSEVKGNSCHQQQLQSALSQIQKEIERHMQPDCYRRGDFFFRPKHPIFALHDAKIAGLQPDRLCHREIFVWLPSCLPGAPDYFSCTCGHRLSKNGYNDDPIARRVKSFPVDYFLLTNRYLCNPKLKNDPGCGTSWQGTDPHIISQLPRRLSVAFPAYISASGAIDRRIMSLMCNTFATRFGPSPFAEMMSELQHKHHAELELMYLDAARSYGYHGPAQVPEFSPFTDPLRYAGAPPSVQYLKAMFVDWVTAHRTFLERAQACLPADVMKVDHTFDYLKYMGGLNGERLHEASYTNVNHFEEIRSLGMVPSKSMAFVKDLLDGVRKGLEENGHPPCSLVYTDSPQTEQGFHEAVTPSLKQDVEHITLYTDLPRFARDSPSSRYTDDTLVMEDLCADILAEVDSCKGVLALALCIQVTDSPSGKRLKAIQLRTHSHNLVFNMLQVTSRAFFPASLRALLSSNAVMKTGCDVHHHLKDLATLFNDIELNAAAQTKTAAVDLRPFAKLKGAVSDAFSSLHVLAGSVLKKNFTPPLISESTHLSWGPPGYTEMLHDEIECIWQVFSALYSQDSVGLPLLPLQAQTDGQLVTLYQANKPIAEGTIVWPHSGSLSIERDENGATQQINITPSRSLICLTKLIVPAAIHTLHHQCLSWIYEHGGFAVVTTSTLRTRSTTVTANAGSVHHAAFAVPMPLPTSESELQDESFSLSMVPSGSEIEVGTVQFNDDDVNSGDEDDDNDNFIEPELDSDLISSTTAKSSDLDGIPNPLLSTLPSRVLDDAYHFMDRLNRLLHKKHTAFKAFTHDFSEAIFIRVKEDEDRVREVLQRKGIDWEYAKRAKASSINQRIRRYEGIICSQSGRSQVFFSKDAREMAKRLLETARLGFLSDPPGISLYYHMGTDKDGLPLYRTIRGTNSVEGGVHMAVRRVFGSLQASPELAECLLLNWIGRRNKKIGYFNRTGCKYRGFHDPWMPDEIYELTVELGIKPSFPLPTILTTRIATTETFGILPLSSQLAEQYNITALPPRRLEGVPHHRDMPVHTLTHLSTKPHNRYRYLQIRQRTLHAVTPVHTYAEYVKFKSCINDRQFRRRAIKQYPPHEAYKLIDFEKLAIYWNSEVEKQDRTESDSNKRLYYKLPTQLERHHKRTIAWKSERSTVMMGSNMMALAPFRDLLTAEDGNNAAMTIPARPLPETIVPPGASDHSYNEDDFYQIDAPTDAPETSFTTSAAASNISQATTNTIADDNDDETPDDDQHVSPLVAVHGNTLGQGPHSSSLEHVDQHHSMDIDVDNHTNAPPLQQAQLMFASSSHASPPINLQSVQRGARCAVCVKALCPRRFECDGRGRREFCKCGHPKLLRGESIRGLTEGKIASLLAARTMG
ncbi:hypothetical protein C8R42DRAFT_729099 [Lentinula raphanica]|nr:hypothetical protein C8R42DRAFT_729099 [Lentinula raphanica]